MKPRLLFLAHRIPYPPNRGDKIRSFNQLKILAEHFDIFLGCCYESEVELSDASPILPLLKDSCFVPAYKTPASLVKDAALSLLSDKSISEQHFWKSELQTWVRQTIQEQDLTGAFVYCSSMMQYLPRPIPQNVNVVTDLIDLDSEKWRQLAATKNNLLSWIYNREAKKVAEAEQTCFERSTYSFFVSESEKQLAANYHDVPSSCEALENGVDTEFYEQESDFSCPEMAGKTYVVFTGTLDAQSNIEAMRWFLHDCWPIIAQAMPDLEMAIVGRNPGSWLTESKLDRVNVFADVEDVRPYIAGAALAVAPMQIGRGVQNKILEAMAMAKAVVMTNEGAAGISLPPPQMPFIADNEQDFANHVIELLKNPEKRDRIAFDNFEWVKTNYNWAQKLSKLKSIFNRKPK